MLPNVFPLVIVVQFILPQSYVLLGIVLVNLLAYEDSETGVAICEFFLPIHPPESEVDDVSTILLICLIASLKTI